MEYCSDSDPLLGVYSATTETKPSAKVLIEDVRVVKFEEEDVYVPTATLESKRAKKGCDTEVTSKEPCAFHTISASYSCSATARVVRYHG